MAASIAARLFQGRTQICRFFSLHSVSKAPLRVGDHLPDILVYEGSPSNGISVAELYKGKKGVLFSIPGAFTPGCSISHIPEYIDYYDKFKDVGYDTVACVSVNDPFVMAAYGKQVNQEGKLRMLADPRCEFTKAIDMQLDCTPLLGNIRSKRYSFLIEDGVVIHMNMEPDHTGLACLLCIKSMGKAVSKEKDSFKYRNIETLKDQVKKKSAKTPT